MSKIVLYLFCFFILLGTAQRVSAQYSSGDYGSTSTGNWNGSTTWSIWNGSTWIATSTFPSADKNVFILSGNTVKITTGSQWKCLNLTVEAGAKLYSNSSLTNIYIYIYGSIFKCNGIIGNGTNFNGISFNIEGPNCILSGTGVFDASRIRKFTNTYTITNFIIARDVNLRFGSGSGGKGTELYNDASNSQFNIVINAGATVNLIGSGGVLGNASIDGIDGSDWNDKAGSYTINGTLNISGVLYLKTNNTIGSPVSFTINNGGHVKVNEIDGSASDLATHSFVINPGGKLEVYGIPTPWIGFSTQNNNYTIPSGGIVEYSGVGLQTIESNISYGDLILSGSGTKSTNATLHVKGNLDLISSNGNTPILNPGIFNQYVGGNWTSYSESAFIEGTTTTIFDQNSSSYINSTGGEKFYNLNYSKTSAATVYFNSSVIISKQIRYSQNGAIDLNGNTLTLINPLPDAISGANAFRYIISEKTDNSSKIKWQIGSVTGPHIFPFGNSDSYIPFTFDLVSGGVADVTVSTYSTSFDNQPWPSTPIQVNNLYSIHGTTPDNRDATVDRFWEVDVSADGTPVSNLTFTYAPDELPISPYNIQSEMRGQWYNRTTNYWQFPLIPGQTTGIYNVTVPGNTSYGPWTLVNINEPLPISLLSFSAELKNGNIDLIWITASEINNNYFTIERSSDGNFFYEIGRISGAGNSTQTNRYNFIDYNPLYELSYYRLKQIDYDGQFSYSEKVAVLNKNDENDWCIFPNPAPNIIYLSNKLKQEFPVSLQLTDAKGTLIKTFDINVTNGSPISVDLTDLSKGVYFGKIIDKYIQKTFKIVKN